MKPTLSWLVLALDQRCLFKPKLFCGSETFTSGSTAQPGPPSLATLTPQHHSYFASICSTKGPEFATKPWRSLI